MINWKIIFPVTVLVMLLACQSHAEPKIIIAENGGEKGLIENSLPTVTLAAARGVDYLAVPVVVTADSELLVFNDITLNRLTDVATIFPGRSREDGNYYVIDFTLSELRQLRLQNVFETDPDALSLSIPTLKEELSLVRRLEKLLKRRIGIVIEIRKPWFHNDEARDISSLTLDTLLAFNYVSGKDKIYLQCYDPEELQRIYRELLPEKQMHLPLIQLIGQNDGLETRQQRADDWEPYNYDWLYTNFGLRMVASYGEAIGLPGELVADSQGNVLLGEYIDSAHKHGLKVLVHSASRKEIATGSGPELPVLLKIYAAAGIDGLYTDSFSTVIQANHSRAEEEKQNTDLPKFFSGLDLSRPSVIKQEPGSDTH